MSTYYITHATKDKNDVITTLKASKDSLTANGEEMSKSVMIARLNAGHTARTWHLGKSEDVRPVGGRYLRTDANEILADNLGDLPPV